MSVVAERALEQAFTDEWGRIVAGLIRRTGDWDLAEECAQQAFAEAVRRWPRDGVPRQPGGWLTTVARNRAIDRLRHEKMKLARLQREAAMSARTEALEPDIASFDTDEDNGDESGIEDDRLRLIFTCCHPALALEARVALTLRTLAGLTTAEIANAFLVPEPTMAKRLVRAKHKIANARIPYRVPPADLLGERTGGVLAVLYLLFNEGYAASTGRDLIRIDLCAEAVRLTRALADLMPQEPEVSALLALILFAHSRRGARVDATGDLVTLEEQDRSLWDREEIDQANRALDAGGSTPEAGPYRLQALIAACHANAARAGDTDWARIAALYQRLLEVMPNPLVALNRAVAVAMACGPAGGLALVDELVAAGELRDYHLLHATRADLLRRLGRDREAGVAYGEALRLARTDAERRYLDRRLREMSQ